MCLSVQLFGSSVFAGLNPAERECRTRTEEKRRHNELEPSILIFCIDYGLTSGALIARVHERGWCLFRYGIKLQ